MNPTTPDQQTVVDTLISAALQILNEAYAADPGAL
jgi:hypothetical protein